MPEEELLKKVTSKWKNISTYSGLMQKHCEEVEILEASGSKSNTCKTRLQIKVDTESIFKDKESEEAFPPRFAEF